MSGPLSSPRPIFGVKIGVKIGVGLGGAGGPVRPHFNPKNRPEVSRDQGQQKFDELGCSTNWGVRRTGVRRTGVRRTGIRQTGVRRTGVRRITVEPILHLTVICP
jgi:hypothetical protein